MPRHTGSVELLMEEDGTLKVVQRYRLTLPGWPKGFDCHRVVRWLNYTICPLDLKSSSTTKPQSSPDSLFLLYLKAFFLFTLGFCVMMMFAVARYSYAFWGYPYDYTAWLLDPFKWSMVVLLPVFVAAVVAAAIVQKKMNNLDLTPPRKEEVKTITGLIQHL